MATYNQVKQDAIHRMTYGYDGPITPFVLIRRAIDFARESEKMGPNDGINDPIANALYETLITYGFLLHPHEVSPCINSAD